MNNTKGKVNKEVLLNNIPKDIVDGWDNQHKDNGSFESIVQLLEKLEGSEARRLADESDKFHKAYATVVDMPADSSEVQELILEHYTFLNKFLYRVYDKFSGISDQGYLRLASLLIDDDVSIKMHDYYRPGLASYLWQRYRSP